MDDSKKQAKVEQDQTSNQWLMTRETCFQIANKALSLVIVFKQY